MLIGLSGQAGTGKDTVAELLGKHGFVRIAFADPVKRIVKDVFDFTDKQLWGSSEFRNKPDFRYVREPDHGPEMEEYLTPRLALQAFGTDAGRYCYKNIWVEYTMKMVAKLMAEPSYTYSSTIGLIPNIHPTDQPQNIVITDCRFLNELDAVRQAGGKLVRVYRSDSGLKGWEGQHSSEKEQQTIPNSYFDHIIYNLGTLADLEDAVDKLVYSMKGG